MRIVAIDHDTQTNVCSWVMVSCAIAFETIIGQTDGHA